MALLERNAVPVPAPTAAVPELSDNDLEQVVGGLERVYVPGTIVSADF
jgi:bacteriocin-like protein